LKENYMKNSVIASQPFHYVVITTIVYALLCPIFFEMDNVYGAGANFVVEYDKTMTYSQQVEEVEPECKSPCPKSAEMCIAMCA
jgi:hypothetical protein